MVLRTTKCAGGSRIQGNCGSGGGFPGPRYVQSNPPAVAVGKVPLRTRPHMWLFFGSPGISVTKPDISIFQPW